MSESIPHVVSAIKAKRVEIAAQVQEAERKLAKLRAALANLDAAAVLLIPGHPEGIPRRQRYQPSKYFGRNELPRLILEGLRKAPGPLLTDEIADRISRFLKAELKRAGVTYAEHAERLGKHGLKGETTDSIKSKLARGTFPATFFVASLAALEKDGMRLEDI